MPPNPISQIIADNVISELAPKFSDKRRMFNRMNGNFPQVSLIEESIRGQLRTLDERTITIEDVKRVLLEKLRKSMES